MSYPRLTPRCVAILCAAGALIVSGHAYSGKLDAAGVAWINTCVADRQDENLDPAALRKYCACMQEIVEDNQPFGITELERTYPPAHEMCHATSGLP